MRTISVAKISEVISKGIIKANLFLPSSVKTALKTSYRKEKIIQAKRSFDKIIKNFIVAEKDSLPLCQDTGIIVVFIEIGQNVFLKGEDLHTAVNRAARDATKKGFLRSSVVSDPFFRKNTLDNTPVILHTDIVRGDRVKVTVMPKGGGAENMSFLEMLTPSVKPQDIEDIVVEKIKRMGTKPCPPIVVGIGLGGNFETCPLLAKKALLRENSNSNKFYRKMEESILKKINRLGIGPQNPQGGNITCLKVRICTAPCHIASMPLAVNINCHSHRYWSTVL